MAWRSRDRRFASALYSLISSPFISERSLAYYCHRSSMGKYRPGGPGLRVTRRQNCGLLTTGSVGSTTTYGVASRERRGAWHLGQGRACRLRNRTPIIFPENNFLFSNGRRESLTIFRGEPGCGLASVRPQVASLLRDGLTLPGCAGRPRAALQPSVLTEGVASTAAASQCDAL